MIFTKFLIPIIVLLFNGLISESRLLIRKNVNSLTHNEWQDLKRGLKVMKERNFRNKYDPLGYFYQANVHGWPDYDGSSKANKIADELNWHKCNHAQYFFLVWHRMFIYFFERILRRAANSPGLTLPYWDYFAADSRSIPQPFRIPADNKTNPLYESNRCKNINEGKPLSERIMSPYPALNTNFFTTYKQNNELNLCHSFGGGRIDAPAFESDREGLLERIPHNNLHVFVGGPDGYMSDLCKSARDPIFYIHHSQTDRIWESWTNAGGRNIIEDKYINQTFDFFDERGELNSYRVGDFLDIKALGYRYDSLITSETIDPTRNERPKLYLPIDAKENLNINYYKRFINLNVRPHWNRFFEKYVQGDFDALDVRFTLQFDLEHLEPDFIFELYLNLNENTIPFDTHPNFIGTLVTFAPKCLPRLRREVLRISKCYDISEMLKRVLKNSYNFNGVIPQTFNLTFVPRFCEQIQYPLSSDDLIRFNEILLVVHKVDESYTLLSSDVTKDNLHKSRLFWDNVLQSIPNATPTPYASESTMKSDLKN